MISKKNARWLFIFLLGHSYYSVFSQNQWTYDFNNGLLPIEKGGPSLHKLGQAGQFIKEKVPGSGENGVPEIIRTVYQFEKNSGLQFDNKEANGFLNKSFTVEIYFKLTELDSWKRVLDFKNRKSDYGSYIYDGKLNFYDFAIGEKAPVRANKYIHYVYSRDFETKAIKMYVNGLSKVEFKDPGTEGVLDNDQVLNLFQDDLVANHEASAGSVALIRVYDRVMTPVFIRRSFQTISRAPKESVAELEPVKEEPKTVEQKTPTISTRLVQVTGKVFEGTNLKSVENAEVSVRKSADDSLVAKSNVKNGGYTFLLTPHESYKISVNAPGYQTKSIPVRTAARATEVKSLISLEPEKFDSPLVTLLFNQSNETLESHAKSQLDYIISYFKTRTDLKIMLKGHTDNIGDFDKNLVLSTQRVSVVKQYLLESGITADRIEGVGYGSTRPAQKNLSEELRKLNRRVEVWAEPIKR
ncbi:Carboxypeptidase regulatory-like domain-containing protein [Dyadobacter koreensis]|uniref:Carboxypeptidase regulatory-like domain-containing protein n=1 Tax=Dyadobacter koreensis TaxID=408657 RepID=A0A1H6TL37_9BACT|nr:OmpA family protein [Dyadobacter koreensis]SEI80026.1 Carboxypeptidase regulatory-like domain-containing protein [Dyadobacter koreensis]